MKKSIIILIAACVAISLTTTGCKSKKNQGLTKLPGSGQVGETGTGTGTGTGPGTEVSGTLPGGTGVTGVPMTPVDPTKTELPDFKGLEGMTPDREIFKLNTVYFEFDKSSVLSGEQSKIQAVADVLKDRQGTKVQIEGHCDERGTEEYNRALGERRALAIREYLLNLGIASERVFTISFGEDKPAVDAHNDAAWTKNRRGEFILYTK